MIASQIEIPDANLPSWKEVPPASNGPMLISNLPTQGPADVPQPWLALAFFGYLYFLGLRSGARRIFAMDWHMPAAAPAVAISRAAAAAAGAEGTLAAEAVPGWLPARIERSYLLLLPPAAACTQVDGCTDFHIIDMAQFAAGSVDPLHEMEHGAAGTPVLIQNFDCIPNSAELNELKLRLLENLVFIRRRHVVLLSHIDPIFHFEAQTDLPDSSRHRWRGLLAGFTILPSPAGDPPDFEKIRQDFAKRLDPALDAKRQFEIARCLAKECVADDRLRQIGELLPVASLKSRDEALAEMERRAAAYYGYLWDNCSKEEQVLLYQIARYRFAHPQAAEAAYQLHRKGLITDNPTSWMMNISFRRFVRAQPEPDPAPATPEEGRRGAIERSAFIVLVAITVPLILGFVIAHGEGVQGYVGIFPAALGALGSLAKILGARKGDQE